MRTKFLLFAFLLSACAPAVREESVPDGPAAEAAPSVYVVRGEPRPNWTPGWSAVFQDDRILLDSPTSAGLYELRAPATEMREGGRTYTGDGLTASIEEDACRLAPYRDGLPDRVTIDWDGGRFEGCGGRRRPNEEMAGTIWQLLRIEGDGAPRSRSPAATLLFGINGEVGGTLACNDGGVQTTWDSGGFVTRGGGFTQTAMGCNQPAAEAFGTRFWNGMVDARAWRREGDRLVVTLGDGSEAELRLLL